MPSELLPGVETETELQYFEEELEINDFPQQIRYRICSRVSDDICALTWVSAACVTSVISG
uniref:Uncharacterized protein n=1 Tax=Parascaris equorum TaxID=6256 RepID=A0A914S282_PAREQ